MQSLAGHVALPRCPRGASGKEQILEGGGRAPWEGRRGAGGRGKGRIGEEEGGRVGYGKRGEGGEERGVSRSKTKENARKKESKGKVAIGDKERKEV